MSYILPYLTFGSASASLGVSSYGLYKGKRELDQMRDQALLDDDQHSEIIERVNTSSLTPEWRIKATAVGIVNGVCNGATAISVITTTSLRQIYGLGTNLGTFGKVATGIQGVGASTNFINTIFCAGSIYYAIQDYRDGGEYSRASSKSYAFNQFMQGGASLVKCTGATLSLITGNPLPAVLTTAVATVISVSGMVGKSFMERNRQNSPEKQPLLRSQPIPPSHCEKLDIVQEPEQEVIPESPDSQKEPTAKEKSELPRSQNCPEEIEIALTPTTGQAH